MRDVAVVGFAQRQMKELDGSPTCLEILVPILADLYEQTGWTKSDIDFWCSGSSDYLAGRSFSFVSAVDAIGTLPPVMESHVEMDAAWAMYEAWVKIQTGEVDTAVVYGFGKSSAGILRRILALQLDPYTAQPLWPDTVSLAGIQAREGLEKGLWDEAAMASVVARSMSDAASNEWAIRRGATSVEDVLAQPLYADPLRRWDCAPVSDGAAAIVIAAGDKALQARQRPAWITGFEHRIEPIALNARSLVESSSTAAAGTAAGTAGVDLAELHAPFSHQELILRSSLGLADDVRVNPSGGALTANPMFSAGLNRIGEAARAIWAGDSDKALAHATSGPVLQQNLVCTMEGR
ncbi:lipid-transfer protein [Nocardioides marmoriginsengisoli]|uniref:Lipid-transfer protein n=1 Tax=Nocardioides marmoriginsengisoli TaxID=661483 RepID=A0A3N0C938_9ACTN|nr:thiolase domain-containing protein [Nocardioides marmoriginsengisoli]RNL59977.1 lipid-transfer protein [Nocardioides marmoriginsengisoli]